MSYIIGTDAFDVNEEKTVILWGIGTRAYYCGEGPRMPKLMWALSDAVKFETREAAEARLLVLCVQVPDLIDHAHILSDNEALEQWTKDLDEFTKRLNGEKEARDAFRESVERLIGLGMLKKLESQRGRRDNG